MIDLFARLFPALAAAVCLLMLLAITMQFRKFVRTVKSQDQKAPDPTPEIVAGLQREVASLAERLAALESEPREPAAPLNIRSGMNLNKRTQALRQYRLGQPSTEIARSLDMPKAEVDLLLKVQRIVAN